MGTLASVFLPSNLELPCSSPLREHPSQSVPHGHRDAITGPVLVVPAAKAGNYPYRLTLAGHKTHGEALASGGEDHDELPQAKYFLHISMRNENIA